jgi:hypothetical protein
LDFATSQLEIDNVRSISKNAYQQCTSEVLQNERQISDLSDIFLAEANAHVTPSGRHLAAPGQNILLEEIVLSFTGSLEAVGVTGTIQIVRVIG